MILGKNKKILITTAIDYTNDVIHIGHAYEKVLADYWARLARQILGKNNAYFSTGTDEHGTTNDKAAAKKRISVLQHVTEISNQDKEEYTHLNLSYDRFIRTTDEDHKKNAEEFFRKSYENGYIYKGKYEGLYCEGCESYKTLSELENGKCPYHPTREIQKHEEDNYFFKWSLFTPFLKELIQSDNLSVTPNSRKSEMLAFLEKGLEDIPITRPKFKLNWGITCPIDETQVLYVWFDALINYHTVSKKLGFWDNDTSIVHFVGKDIARWHVLLWPAMLKSVNEKTPDVVNIHAFMNLNGQKISKSTGNVIRPSELVQKYGTDAVRWYLLKFGPGIEDVDISEKHLKEIYNADLANGIGNTVARIAKLAEKVEAGFPTTEKHSLEEIYDDILKPLDEWRVDLVINNITEYLSKLDAQINNTEPWKISDPKKLYEVLAPQVEKIRNLAKILEPILPNTADHISAQFLPSNIKSQSGLFPRLN